MFFATFRINRLSQGGGVSVSETGACHVSTTLAPTEDLDTAYDGMRSVDDGLHLSDPTMLDAEDEHGDRVRQQILSVFPGFAMQRTYNVMAIRQFVPRGVDKTDLNWIRSTAIALYTCCALKRLAENVLEICATGFITNRIHVGDIGTYNVHACLMVSKT